MKLLLENWRDFTRLSESINPATIERIESALKQAGAESYIVGGAVRDELMPGTPPSKDIDFLIRGLALSDIASALSHLGKVKEVGQAFGVVTAIIDGEEFDFAIPRTSEIKTGEAHTDFEVTTDPYATIESDLSRRDFTFNALAKDSEGNIIDMFGGRQDIQDKVIRAIGDPNDRFSEDPLRMMRAIQFATRFDFDIEPDTLSAIKKNLDKIKTIAGERVLMEFTKAWTKGSINLDKMVSLLKDTGIGQTIFGKEFDPVSVNISGDHKNKTIGSFMAFFLKGGDYNYMKPTSEMIKYLDLAKKAAEDKEEVYEYGMGQRALLPLVAEVLTQVGEKDQAAKIKAALKYPLSAKELDISGRDLMQIGIEGKEIGSTLAAVVAAIHAAQVKNEYDDIMGFIQK